MRRISPEKIDASILVVYFGPESKHKPEKNGRRPIDVVRRAEGQRRLDDIAVLVDLSQFRGHGQQFLPGFRRSRDTGSVENVAIVVQGQRIDRERQSIDLLIRRIDEVVRDDIDEVIAHFLLGYLVLRCRNYLILEFTHPGVSDSEDIRPVSRCQSAEQLLFVRFLAEFPIRDIADERVDSPVLLKKRSVCVRIIKYAPDLKRHTVGCSL